VHLGGRAVLRNGGGYDGTGDAPLPADLRADLQQWIAVADTVQRTGDAHQLEVVRQRGRQLAARAADVLGRPVEFVDPVSGAVESIPARPPLVLAPEPPEPTPWATGLLVSAFFAVLVAIADIVLVNAFAGTFGLLWVPANLLLTAGTAPSLWTVRQVPFWRWPALGAAAGLAAAWVVLLLGLLG
jgi:hypothetical protein